MTDLLQRGAEWLAGMFRRHASRPVTYRRGAASVELTAPVGRTEFAAVDAAGVATTYESRDYLPMAEDLVLVGVQIVPLPGDRIEETDAAGVTRTYEVMAPGKEPCWRWSDASYLRRRIHTKLVENG